MATLACSQGVREAIFFLAFFCRVTHDGLSEIGTARILGGILLTMQLGFSLSTELSAQSV